MGDRVEKLKLDRDQTIRNLKLNLRIADKVGFFNISNLIY